MNRADCPSRTEGGPLHVRSAPLPALAPPLRAAGAVRRLRPARSGPKAPRKLALLVGVNAYDRRGFDKLQFAERDADELGKALTALGFDVIVLKGSSKGELRATRANIDAHLKKVLAKVKHRNDVVLVSLCGHGQELKVKGDDGKEADAPFFCPVDAILNDAKSQLSLSYVLDDLLGKEGGKNLLLVDACRSRPKDAGRRARGVQGRRMSLPESTAVLFSCRSEQESFESDKAGGGHGLFTWCVLDGLRGKAAREGKLPWTGLVHHVEERMESRLVRDWLPEGRAQAPIAVGNVGRTLLGALALNDPGRIEVSVKDGGKMVMHFAKVPRGKFTMGSPKTEKDRHDGEEEHKVELTRDYWMGKTEVTRGQFRVVVADTGYETDGEKGDGAYGWDDKKKAWEKNARYSWGGVGFAQTDEHPVVCVSWNDAKAFCAWCGCPRRRSGSGPAGVARGRPTRSGTTRKICACTATWPTPRSARPRGTPMASRGTTATASRRRRRATGRTPTACRTCTAMRRSGARTSTGPTRTLPLQKTR